MQVFLLPLHIDALLKCLKPGRKPGKLGCYEPERVKVIKVEEEVSLLFVTSIYSFFFVLFFHCFSFSDVRLFLIAKTQQI